MSGRPSSFTITAAGQKVGLDAAGTARASFTVTNTSAQALTGRLLTRPRDPAKPEWFSIVGESVRDFAPNASEQVVVQLDAPPGSPLGSYSFRLDAVSEVDPDEDFTEGPSVAFEVTAPPPPKKKLPWWWWIVAIVGAVVLLIIIGVVVWLLTKGDGAKPAAPVLVSPSESMVFVSVPAPIQVKWDPVSSDASYIVEVQKCPTGFADCDATNVPFRMSEPQPGTQFDVVYPDREPGRVRVTSVVQGERSDPSAWRTFVYDDPNDVPDHPPSNWCVPCLLLEAQRRPGAFDPRIQEQILTEVRSGNVEMTPRQQAQLEQAFRR